MILDETFKSLYQRFFYPKKHRYIIWKTHRRRNKKEVELFLY